MILEVPLRIKLNTLIRRTISTAAGKGPNEAPALIHPTPPAVRRLLDHPCAFPALRVVMGVVTRIGADPDQPNEGVDLHDVITLLTIMAGVETFAMTKSDAVIDLVRKLHPLS